VLVDVWFTRLVALQCTSKSGGKGVFVRVEWWLCVLATSRAV
jgi:hypothetical protein